MIISALRHLKRDKNNKISSVPVHFRFFMYYKMRIYGRKHLQIGSEIYRHQKYLIKVTKNYKNEMKILYTNSRTNWHASFTVSEYRLMDYIVAAGSNSPK